MVGIGPRRTAGPLGKPYRALVQSARFEPRRRDGATVSGVGQEKERESEIAVDTDQDGGRRLAP